MHRNLNLKLYLNPAFWYLCLSILSAAAASAQDLKPGDPFPDLSRFALERAIPERNGKVVLIDFFASWCAPCHQSFPVLKELQKRYATRGLVIIAVSVDAKKQDLQRFLKKHEPGFSTLHDPKGKLAAELKLPTMPTSYLLTREGKISSIHAGFHGAKTQEKYVAEIESLLE